MLTAGRCFCESSRKPLVQWRQMALGRQWQENHRDGSAQTGREAGHATNTRPARPFDIAPCPHDLNTEIHGPIGTVFSGW
jgi:hypothetical protein